jgi:putative glutamine amidotransferase
MSGPVIVGITTAELCRPERERPTPESEPPQRKLTLGMDYTAAVAGAGGLPVVIPPLSLPDEALLDRLDALLVSGGPDIDPALYGSRPHAHLGPIEHEADPLELELVRIADAREMPILAICRGMQLVNVARGGRLWQDLPSERPSTIQHRQAEPGTIATHPVAVADGSRLAELTRPAHDVPEDDDRLLVNSFHHQAVRELGDGLRVTARAADGVIEAFEAVDRPFLVGVQWHAESLVRDPRHAALFFGLVAAARSRTIETSPSG